jgi:hypothetical protein
MNDQIADERMRRSARPSNVLKIARIALLVLLPATVTADDTPNVYSFGDLDLLGQSPHYLDVGVGVFDVFERKSTSRRSAAGRVEFRVGHKIYGIGPAVGFLANTDGGAYGYGAVYADLKYHELVFTPLAGLGAYHEGDRSDLGGVFQFRLALGVSYQFADKSRAGLTLAHISNAGIHDENPGEDEIYLSYSLPF